MALWGRDLSQPLMGKGEGTLSDKWVVAIHPRAFQDQLRGCSPPGTALTGWILWVEAFFNLQRPPNRGCLRCWMLVMRSDRVKVMGSGSCGDSNNQSWRSLPSEGGQMLGQEPPHGQGMTCPRPWVAKLCLGPCCPKGFLCQQVGNISSFLPLD